jgi:hypothetical protein
MYDHDGWLDLFVGRYLTWTWESNPACAAADGTGRAYCHPKQFAPVANVLLRNNGDGTFTDASASTGIATHHGRALGVAIHDFDRDGRVDLFVANDSMQQYLFRNTGGRAFVEVALEAGVAYDDDGRSFAGMGVDAEDYDNDGWPDVIVTALSLERYALYRGVGRGRLEYASHTAGVGRATLQSSGWGTKFVDSDNDGRRDLFVAQGHLLDMVSRARQGFDYLQPPLLRNDGGNANHWLTVSLRGTRSNRQGIGAIVSVVDEHGRTASGICSTSSSYLSVSGDRVHFGLAAAKRVRRVEVRWASGAVQVLKEICRRPNFGDRRAVDGGPAVRSWRSCRRGGSERCV